MKITKEQNKVFIDGEGLTIYLPNSLQDTTKSCKDFLEDYFKFEGFFDTSFEISNFTFKFIEDVKLTTL